MVYFTGPSILVQKTIFSCDGMVESVLRASSPNDKKSTFVDLLMSRKDNFKIHWCRYLSKTMIDYIVTCTSIRHVTLNEAGYRRFLKTVLPQYKKELVFIVNQDVHLKLAPTITISNGTEYYEDGSKSLIPKGRPRKIIPKDYEMFQALLNRGESAKAISLYFEVALSTVYAVKKKLELARKNNIPPGKVHAHFSKKKLQK